MSGGAIPPAFRRLCAREQLALLREYPRLMPRLLQWGLSAGDAQALAYNAVLLYKTMEVQPPLRSPGQVLERYSIGEIADLCETYHQVAAGELEYGESGGDHGYT